MIKPISQEAGKLLLNPEPIIFSGRELELIEDDLPAPARKSSGPMFVPRGAAGRPRAGTCRNPDGVAIDYSVRRAIDDGIHIRLVARRSGEGPLCLCRGRKKKQ